MTRGEVRRKRLVRLAVAEVFVTAFVAAPVFLVRGVNGDSVARVISIAIPVWVGILVTFFFLPMLLGGPGARWDDARRKGVE